MKIGCIADLHINQDKINSFLTTINEIAIDEQIDLLLIAGDISNNNQMTIEFVRAINKFIPTYYVPGNHDLWQSDDEISNWEIYNTFINDEYCLLNKRIKLATDYSLVGHIAWYDYSLANQEKYSKAEFDAMCMNERVWNDKKYNGFTKTNQLICHQFNQEIAQQIKECNDNIILMTHMISHPKLIIDTDKRRNHIDYFSGFCGSRELYELTKNKQVKYAISGHVHYRKQIIENDTKYLCPCLGSELEWKYYECNNNLKDNLLSAIQYIELK